MEIITDDFELFLNKKMSPKEKEILESDIYYTDKELIIVDYLIKNISKWTNEYKRKEKLKMILK